MGKMQGKRKFMRIAPDPDEYVQIDKEVAGPFNFGYAGLVVEESPLTGCSIVCLDSVGLETGLQCRLKVGHMGPILSEIIWKREIDENVSRYGDQILRVIRFLPEFPT